MATSDVLGLMACDGVGVQWQNGDLCGASLVSAVLCGTHSSLFAALQSSSLLLCLYVNLRLSAALYAKIENTNTNTNPIVPLYIENVKK